MDVGVFVLIQDEAGRVLFVQDAGRERLWTLPGGALEFQELPTTCAVREAQEEANIGIETTKLLGIFVQKKTPGIVILLEARIVSGEPHPDGIETSACEFFSLIQLLEMRDQVKPAQLSMVHQVLDAEASDLPIFNHFVPRAPPLCGGARGTERVVAAGTYPC